MLLRLRFSFFLWRTEMKYKFELMVNRLRMLLDDTEAQDLVEYALLAGFVAVAAGALLPGISSSISQIFSKMGSVLSVAAS
jgi:pilus assembly protein Flp/PilA